MYDVNEIREVEVNCNNKATCLKGIILNNIGLNHCANITLMKQVATDNNPEGGSTWMPLSKKDYE